MKKPVLKFLLPASALALLASFSVPSLRADDTVGSLADSNGSIVDAAAPGSAAAPANAAKKGKKKHGKKKHPKKAKATPAADSPAASAAPADAAK
jgi:hypothetical protein